MAEITEKELDEIIAIEEDEAEYLEMMDERKMETKDRDVVQFNIISNAEMKAYMKEMHNEMDSKFVEVLMATGVTRSEAIKHVREWNAEGGYGYNGY